MTGDKGDCRCHGWHCCYGGPWAFGWRGAGPPRRPQQETTLMSKRKIILTIAPTGGMAHKSQNPHLPTQPSEIADDVVRCFNAGAIIAALHTRPPEVVAPCDPAFYATLIQMI